MGDIALSIGGIGGIGGMGGIGAVVPVTMQINPVGSQDAVPAAGSSAAAGPAASVVVNVSDAAWQALAVEAAAIGGVASLTSRTLEDLAAAALLALLLADRQQETPAAAAIKTYLLIQALNDL